MIYVKRLILLIAIFAVSAIYFVSRFDVQLVDARQSETPRFVDYDNFNRIMQSNLDLLWNELDSIKETLNSINSRLDKLEQS